MGTMEVQGTTLGEKHLNYNKIVKDAADKNGKLPGNYTKDVENLIRIDVASQKRDLEYILNILKCDDMLYVSRAIKKCPWLITDRQYSYIINPDYLHTQLFPHMMSKASAKLMLNIRLHLKEEDRVEVFYTYIKEKDLNAALKWLPHCPLPLIEKEVEKLNDKIDKHLFKRLCERSITVLENFVKNAEAYCYSLRERLALVMFFINNETVRYLDVIEKLSSYQIPRFGPKEVEKIMKTCPERITQKFEFYSDKIHLQTFAKQLKQEEIKEFLTKQSQNKELRCWFKYENLVHFIKCMPKEGRFEYLKKFFIEKKNDAICDDRPTTLSDDVFYCASSRVLCISDCATSANIYRWYQFAPFETAFQDLTKLIRAESSPAERIAIFNVLISCAKRNLQHVRTLLQYYNDKHINEPFKFKIQFVNIILSRTPTYKFDENTWTLLNNLFCSMEVYTDSENNVQSCIEAIIVHKVIHNEAIPEIIVKKFKFNSLKSLKLKLNNDEKEKVFTYLYTNITAKMQNKTINNENDLFDVVTLLEEELILLMDWKKDLKDYPLILDKIKEIIKIKESNGWKTDLSTLYNKNKTWRRIMFKESIIMWPSEETCYNALKHDPSLLSRHEVVIQELRRNDSVSLRHLLRKLRVYWPQSLATQWAGIYLSTLQQPSGHKALVDGICALLPQDQLIDILKKYAPTETKINWSDDNELTLSLRKQLARNMYLCRPPPPIDIVLLYAHGDYLQFALPSLNAVLQSMSSEHIRQNVFKLLDAPVSLQKHGIRYASSKLEPNALKKLFYDIWNKAKNPSIRAVLFQQTFELLCKQKKPLMIEEIWQLLSIFIDNLSTEENKSIYNLLAQVDKVPLLVRGKFFMKSYTFLKTLPAKANCEWIINKLKRKMDDVMEHLDAEFVEGIILDGLDKKITASTCEEAHVIAAYLICAKDEEIQSKRYQRIMLPILERAFATWDINSKEIHSSRNVSEILELLFKFILRFVFEKGMVFPTKLFMDIRNQIEKRLPVEKNYILLTYWKLTSEYVKLLEEHKSLLLTVEKIDEAEGSDKKWFFDPQSEKKWNGIFSKITSAFADICLKYLKEDIDKYFPSIFWIFANALEKTLTNINQLIYYEFLKVLVNKEEFVPSYLLVLTLLPEHLYADDDKMKTMYKEIRSIIRSHPSTEVKMHYYRKYDQEDEE